MRKCCVSWFRSIRPALAALAAFALFAVAGAPAVQAQDGNPWQVRQDGVRIFDYGIYAYSDLGVIEAPEDISGRRFAAADVRLLRRTQTILAQSGLAFGLRFRVRDPALIGKTLTFVMRFPRMTDPRTGRSGDMLVDRFLAIGIVRRQLFRFDHLWEMAAGRWTMTLLDGRRVVAEVPFKVVVAFN